MGTFCESSSIGRGLECLSENAYSSSAQTIGYAVSDEIKMMVSWQISKEVQNSYHSVLLEVQSEVLKALRHERS